MSAVGTGLTRHVLHVALADGTGGRERFVVWAPNVPAAVDRAAERFRLRYGTPPTTALAVSVAGSTTVTP